MRRTRHHLRDEVFLEGAYFVSITICTAKRTPLFEGDEPATIIREEIERIHHKRSPVLVYCVMPDHVHAILSHRFQSLSETGRLLKGRTSRRVRQGRQELEIWQPGYYDHIIQRSEGIYRCVQYVLNNPVRKGLASNWWDWPWSGAPALGPIGPDLFWAVAPEDICWNEIACGD